LARDERLGFVTCSPENLGNSIRASIRLKLAQNEDKINELADKFELKIFKLPDDDGNVYEVSSKKRLGVTEFQMVKDFADGIVALIDAEKTL
jgi:protein-arginine kinase